MDLFAKIANTPQRLSAVNYFQTTAISYQLFPYNGPQLSPISTERPSAVNYFHKNLNLRCLTGSKIHLFISWTFCAFVNFIQPIHYARFTSKNFQILTVHLNDSYYKDFLTTFSCAFRTSKYFISWFTSQYLTFPFCRGRHPS